MALNFSVSYTFSPSTTISSSQVNTNTSDVAAVFNGLEAETKTLAKLKMDADPTIALEVATKQYVDHYATYRRPNLQYSSGTVVIVETGLDGTSGDVTILFPDGNLRTDSTTGRVQCNLGQVAALSGSWQSGLRTGSLANNTWYAIYAVKTTDDTSKMVMVADSVMPIRANYATLNSNFGTSGWVYLGLVRSGDSNGASAGVLKFSQSGNRTKLDNLTTGLNTIGVLLANSSSATSVSYAYSAGNAGQVIANNITLVDYSIRITNPNSQTVTIQDPSTTNIVYWQFTPGSGAYSAYLGPIDAGPGLKISTTATTDHYISLAGWVDGVLGVGANPLL